MPQTPPFHALLPGRPLTEAELARAIRLDMEAELDAINLYEAHLEAASHPEARAILQHVMDEEKEHQALFQELLQRLDPAQRTHAREASRKYQLIVSGASHQEVESAGKQGDGGEAPAGLTVGALRTR